MKDVTLAATVRTETGKGASRQSRMSGNIPAVVYGPDIKPSQIEVSEKELRTAVKEAHSTSAIFNLEIDGKKSKVIIRDMQRDPVTSTVTHIDFQALSMNKPIHMTVPINITGTAEGVKTEGGILQTTLRELEITCLPKDIPDEIEVEVTELGIGESIHVRDLEVPNVKILTEERRTVVVVAAPTVVKEPEPEEEELAEGELPEGELPEGEVAEGEAAEGKAKTEAPAESDDKKKE
jgi:large subunit ribosomal protein L25